MNIAYDKINEWTESLTKRLIEIRFFDAEEIKTVLSVHLALAMKSCMEIQLSDTIRKINQVKIRIANCQGVGQQKFQAELIKLKEQHNEELKLLKQTTAIARKDEKYNLLCSIVARKFGDESYEQIKSELKLILDGFKENKNGEHLPESGYKRGRKELIEELKKEFADKGMTDSISVLEKHIA